MKKLSKMTFAEREDLSYSDEYASFIMEHSGGTRIICNGDTLLQAMEEGFLFDEFIKYLEKQDATV